MKAKFDEAGLCPLCGSDSLDYGVREADDLGVVYPYVCGECGLQGNEYYDLHFSEHNHLYTKEDEEVVPMCQQEKIED